MFLVCDAPNCGKTMPAAVRQGRVAEPDGWWMQVAMSGQIVVGCCTDHFNDAVKQLS
jgi:hypothetical protein